MAKKKPEKQIPPELKLFFHNMGAEVERIKKEGPSKSQPRRKPKTVKTEAEITHTPGEGMEIRLHGFPEGFKRESSG